MLGLHRCSILSLTAYHEMTIKMASERKAGEEREGEGYSEGRDMRCCICEGGLRDAGERGREMASSERYENSYEDSE